MRYQYTNVCLYFNYPRYRCYWRVLKRILYKDKRIQDRAPHCPEKASWSLLTYMWRFEKRVNPILNRLQKLYPAMHFIEVRKEKDLKKIQHEYGWKFEKKFNKDLPF